MPTQLFFAVRGSDFPTSLIEGGGVVLYSREISGVARIGSSKEKNILNNQYFVFMELLPSMAAAEEIGEAYFADLSQGSAR